MSAAPGRVRSDVPSFANEGNARRRPPIANRAVPNGASWPATARAVRTRSLYQTGESMAYEHEYDCIVCGAHFGDEHSLDVHNRETHLKNATGNEVPRDPAHPPEGSGP